MEKKEPLPTVVVAAATVAAAWGAWQLIPAVIGMVAGFAIAFAYGFQAFDMPAWAFGLGLGLLLFTLVLVFIGGPDYRKQIGRTALLMLKFSVLLIFCIGALSFIMQAMPPMPDMTGKRLEGVNEAVEDAGNGLKTAVCWLIVVVLPFILAVLAFFTKGVSKEKAAVSNKESQF